MLREAKFTKTVINQEMISNYQELNRNMMDFGIMPMMEEETESDGQDSLLKEIEMEMKKDASFSDSTYSNPEKSDIDEKLPYITNISEDQLLSGRLKYSCIHPLLIGNKQAVPKPDITLATLGI